MVAARTDPSVRAGIFWNFRHFLWYNQTTFFGPTWLQGKEFQISQANTYLKEKHNVIFCILAELDMTLQFTNVHILLISVYINVDLQIYFILKRQMTKPRQGLPFIRLFEFYNYMFIHLLLLLRYLICESFNQETKTTTFWKSKSTSNIHFLEKYSVLKWKQVLR